MGDIAAFLVLTVLVPVLINKSTEGRRFDWLKPYLREAWTLVLSFFTIYAITKPDFLGNVVMEWHKKHTGVAGYLAAATFGAVLLTFYWWLSGKWFPSEPHSPVAEGSDQRAAVPLPGFMTFDTWQGVYPAGVVPGRWRLLVLDEFLYDQAGDYMIGFQPPDPTNKQDIKKFEKIAQTTPYRLRIINDSDRSLTNFRAYFKIRFRRMEPVPGKPGWVQASKTTTPSHDCMLMLPTFEVGPGESFVIYCTVEGPFMAEIILPEECYEYSSSDPPEKVSVISTHRTSDIWSVGPHK